MGLRYGPYSYGGQQSRGFRNGGNPDGATPRVGWNPSGCKPLSTGKKASIVNRGLTVPGEEAPAKSVPAAAVIRAGQALFGFIGRKARVGGYLSLV